MTKKNVDVEFDSDVGYPYHLQPDIIKMALLMLPYLMDKNINSKEFKDWKYMREKKMN